MKLLVLFFLLLTLLACEKSKQPPKTMAEPSGKKSRGKMFAGKPDLPENEYQITSAGIGKLKLGDSLNKTHVAYDSVTDIYVHEQGGKWPGKKIILGEDEWIIAESVNSVDRITAIYTNSSKFKTKNGFHAGMILDSIDKAQDSLLVYKNENAFLLYKSGIWFKIDPKAEKKFFRNKNHDLGTIKNSSIKQLFIICGDC